MPERETWWGYVQRIAGHVPHKDIAAKVQLHSSRLTGWQKGERPSAEAAAEFARAYRRPVLEALVIAGYVRADETGGDVIEVGVSLREWSDDDLVREVMQRLSEYRRIVGAERSPYDLEGAAGWGPRYRASVDRALDGKQSRVRRG